MSPVRVVHVPGRTPYVRKLGDGQLCILNGVAVEGRHVPRDVTLRWLLNHRPWDWLDVIHVHHTDFEPVARLRAALGEARRVGVQVLFTAHDTAPVFGRRAAHHQRLRALADCDVPFICLTRAAEEEMRWRLGVRTVFAPHGYVAPPGTRPRSNPRPPGPTRFLIYGSLRPNRDLETVLHCWRFARDLADTTLHLLLRAPSRASMSEDSAVWRAIRDHAADARLQVDVRPFPTDADVNAAVADTDCLLLPYRWASHSGQLEHAFDLGALPVASRVGYVPDQVTLHDSLVGEPIWFDWSDNAVYAYGARLLTAMVSAHAAIQNGWHPPDIATFDAHRHREHDAVLAAHRALYRGEM